MYTVIKEMKSMDRASSKSEKGFKESEKVYAWLLMFKR